MLTKLKIHDYALVEKIEIDFGPGLTVLTGETGAGKSVIIGGLLLALGERADRELIRHGARKTVVEAEFDLTGAFLPGNLIRDRFGAPESSVLRLFREISQTGSSRACVNDQAVGLSKIKDAAPYLADFHSQQGQRSLLSVDQHVLFLDSFAGLTKTVERLAELYREYFAVQKQLQLARDNAAAMRDRFELVHFQIDELTKAAVRVGEEQELENQRRRLESIQTLMEAAQITLDAVGEGDSAVLPVLAQVNKQLKQAGEIDNKLAELAELLSGSITSLNELSQNLQTYLSRLEHDPERLEEINGRLSTLFRLRKKYGTDEAGLVAKLDEFTRETLGQTDFDALIKSLTDRLASAQKAYLDLAREVSDKRRKDAPRLEKMVEKHLADLGLSKANFKLDFQTDCDENGLDVDGEKLAIYPHGLENIEFLISTNPNEPLKPLVKTASGGELSRIMLALLTIIAGKYRLPTIIFDEIDTGIGGVTAAKLAAKLKALAKNHQVIAISHLPAVASQADHHLAVSKTLKDGRNVITVKEVTGKEIEKELTRMRGIV